MKILGVDYGSKRVGIAISDEGAKFAFPKTVIVATGDLAENIALLASAEGASVVVMGESVNFGGEDNSVMGAIRSLATDLRERGFEVVLEPEYFSSAEASRFQGEREDIDASAAAVILQRYLDKHQDSR
ncbi:MAG TPA: RuvX/YqgF family protein [Candidatus Paceibacterota bacterium]|nr:RuvX/YqgF family protein [Candidatus Paceibacterota bacterium]